ncbi:hydrogenase formation protein HypD [Candidatus Oleimmundimicrobium sp.]|uniref:hydrogenase formation protein HypD n=1 Tax=Candidatus Oleimmundimicrobium sp. TaxID=3060597 RepID=UPI00271FA9A6|nr:hydrogenase formation protein HypD [Candidatus Oleimmundimicrobium sp.]MDO8886330.1 hydrogenase formation protein HypD [Candidatus Oleimmundimicrobium sp.]
MRYLSEYRDPTIAKKLIEDIKKISKKPVKFMEVCGTHTVSISKNGIRQVLPENISLLSGPGCPVCVTANGDIDKAIAIAEAPGVIFTTFGDMMKVPGSYSSLSEKSADGADIRVVYSTLDALKIAKNNPDKKVVFFAVGFETTAPTIALSILEAERQGIKNYFIYSVHKMVPPAMAALLNLGEVKLDGFICPGHVSAIIGSKPYEFIARDHKISCVIAGFEPIDILQSISMLVKQVENGEAKVEIGYKRGVSSLGNTKAQEVMKKVFEACDAEWRGIGVIPESGLSLRTNFEGFDASKIFDVDVPPTKEHLGCSCGEILRGVKLPYDCKLFGKACTPENPIGPCMVSTEGSCAAYYRYGEVVDGV